MVPDVQKTFGGAADAVLRWLGRPCDLAALMAVCTAMGRLMGACRDSAAFFALLRVIPELSASFWSPRRRRVLRCRRLPCTINFRVVSA